MEIVNIKFGPEATTQTVEAWLQNKFKKKISVNQFCYNSNPFYPCEYVIAAPDENLLAVYFDGGRIARSNGQFTLEELQTIGDKEKPRQVMYIFWKKPKPNNMLSICLTVIGSLAIISVVFGVCLWGYCKNKDTNKKMKNTEVIKENIKPEPVQFQDNTKINTLQQQITWLCSIKTALIENNIFI